MDLKDTELLNELIVESREHLSAIEPDLLALEKDGDRVSDELINRVFRAIHSIKGGFGFFGFDNIKNLSHSMENVLDLLRNRKLAASTALVDALFKGIDRLRKLLGDIQQSDAADIAAELALLAPFHAAPGGPGGAGGAVEEGAALAAVDKERLFESVRRGKTVYHVTFREVPAKLQERLSEWSRIGEVLDIKPPPALSGKAASEEAEFNAVVASILEADLIAAGLKLSESQIRTVDTTAVKQEIARKKKADEKPAPSGSAPGKEGGKASGPAAGTAAAESSDSLRVRVNLLNKLMTLAGELVLSRNQLLQNLNRKLSDSIDEARFDPAVIRQTLGTRLGDLRGLNVILQNIDRITTEMQENIMQTRLQPLGVVFNKFPRLVRDLARDLKKEVRLDITGADVELDKSIIEMLSDPITHIVRNSVDHGIENPDDRDELGKDRVGVVSLTARHESGKVLIEISDDGGGIDVRRVRDKAIERGLCTREDAAGLPDREILNFIFMPGFSTATTVTEVSGRGVGMDVVRTNIEKLGGSVAVESEFGKGMRVTMTLPLTLAIIPSLIVSVEGRRFAIPQVSLEELVRIRAREVAQRIERVHGSSVLRLRGKLLPLIHLADLLGFKRTFSDPGTGDRREDRREKLEDRRESRDEAAAELERRAAAERRRSSQSSAKIVVLKLGDNRFGLLVDQVHDNEEIIVKPLSAYFKKCQIYAGAAILGDGRVALILDALGVSSVAGFRFAELQQASQAERERAASDGRLEEQELLTFRNGTGEIYAVDLSMVARVEKIAAADIERVGDKEYLKYEDRSLRLLRLHHFLPVRPAEEAPPELFVIVPKLVRHPMGIVATQVEDVLQSHVVIDRRNVTGPGLLGSAIIQKKMILLLDVYRLFELAEPAVYGGGGAAPGLEGRRILLAEDTDFFRTVEENYLKAFGITVECARDGEEAWQRLNAPQAHFDLLLSDIEMPGLNGIDLARKVKDSPRLRNLPVVMLTSLRAEKYRLMAEAAGADGYEVKLNKDELRATLLRILAPKNG